MRLLQITRVDAFPQKRQASDRGLKLPSRGGAGRENFTRGTPIPRSASVLRRRNDSATFSLSIAVLHCSLRYA